MHNMLVDPVLRAHLRTDATAALSLPDVYAALMRDEVLAFPALRPHQRHAWHAFLAQLGTIALHRAGMTEPPRDGESWRGLIRGLTPDFAEDEPWCLVVDDLSRPAFLQPPVPERSIASWKQVDAADALDVLVTSRNFDIKRAVAVGAEPDDWLLALVSLQTMEGFLGAGNYGIARMNGGFSARPCLGYAPATGGLGAHLRRDIVAMLATRPALLEQGYGYQPEGGVALLWLEPWDGNSARPLDGLDPYFIEICRRVRLKHGSDGRIAALATTSKGPRLAAKHLNGVLGDFWTPVNIKDGKALSLPGGGFDARMLTRLLFDPDFRQPAALSLTPAERRSSTDWLLIARGMARGQGKTEGWHEAVIPLRRQVALAFSDAASHRLLGDIARLQIEEIGWISRSLSWAIGIIAEGGKPDDRRRGKNAAATYIARLQAEADARFFAALQARFTAEDGEAAEARFAFIKPLVDVARALLAEAAASVPCPAIQRPRARARAERAFWGMLRAQKRNPLRLDPDVIALLFPTEMADERAERRSA